MEIEACYCSLDIKGLEMLPAHYHVQDRAGDDAVVFWVNWRQIMRELVHERVLV